MTRKTIATAAGDIITDTIIRMYEVQTVTDGYSRYCPTTTCAIAYRADGNGWEAIFEADGAISSISEDDVYVALSFGGMDDANQTVADMLIAGAEHIRSWSTAIRGLDSDNESLRELSTWLDMQAYHAVRVSDEPEQCAAVAAECNIEEAVQ